MKKLFLETSFSKIYMIVMIIITLLIVGGYFSYAMFTVSKEKSNAIRIVTGNLTYKLTVDGKETNTLTVGSKETKTFTVTLSNPNNRIARFNFYYVGSLPTDVTAGYVTGDGLNTPPVSIGINLEKADVSGSSNTYSIRVSNKSSSSATITLGVSVGLDYNDLTLPENGHLFEEIVMTGKVSDIVIDNLSSGSTYDDGIDTFITGEDPNNYIWYSGKLWRAVSVNNDTEATKLVTQWNISAINYSNGSTAFDGSYMEDWLNNTSVDGFLGNLRDYENFIVTNSVWDATMDDSELGSIKRPNGGTTVIAPVGLLNTYEYQSSNDGQTNSYLNNGLYWWTLTQSISSNIRSVGYYGDVSVYSALNAGGVRPSINLKSNVTIVDGDGTIDNPYRLMGDNDTNLSGTFLNTRYSGEYIRFGNDENNLYRIVSHENGSGTKIVSAEPLKSSGTFITSAFGNNTTFSSTNTVGSFLNNDYLNTGNGYLTDEDIAMIEDSTTWYLGTVGKGTSYKLAKYTDETGNTLTSSTTTSKVGLLRLGELMSGQFERYALKDENSSTGLTAIYWTLTPYNISYVRSVSSDGNSYGNNPSNSYSIRSSLNLKSNVVITSGTGTKSDPFEIALQ